MPKHFSSFKYWKWVWQFLVNFASSKLIKKQKQSCSCTETKTPTIKSGLLRATLVWFQRNFYYKPFLSTRIPMRLCRMRAVGGRREAPSVLAQSVSASISSICQLLKISLSPSRQSWFSACCSLDEPLSRHTFFFIEINDNSVMYLQLQLLPDAAGCQWLSARGRQWDLWLSAEQIHLNQNLKNAIWLIWSDWPLFNINCIWIVWDGGRMRLSDSSQPLK